MENLLSAILEVLAEPAVSYIGLGYDKTIGIRAGLCCVPNDKDILILEKICYLLVSLQANCCNETCSTWNGELYSYHYIPTALYNSEPDPVFPILSEYMQAKTLVSETSAHLRVQTFSFFLG